MYINNLFHYNQKKIYIYSIIINLYIFFSTFNLLTFIFHNALCFLKVHYIKGFINYQYYCLNKDCWDNMKKNNNKI